MTINNPQKTRLLYLEVLDALQCTTVVLDVAIPAAWQDWNSALEDVLKETN